MCNRLSGTWNRDSSKQEADHHAKILPSTAWLMTILQSKNTTVGIVATCSRRGPHLELFITAEIAYYTQGSRITQNCQWKYLLRPTASKIPITHHHQLLLQETAWPLFHRSCVCMPCLVAARPFHKRTFLCHSRLILCHSSIFITLMSLKFRTLCVIQKHSYVIRAPL